MVSQSDGITSTIILGYGEGCPIPRKNVIIGALNDLKDSGRACICGKAAPSTMNERYSSEASSFEQPLAAFNDDRSDFRGEQRPKIPPLPIIAVLLNDIILMIATMSLHSLFCVRCCYIHTHSCLSGGGERTLRSLSLWTAIMVPKFGSLPIRPRLLSGPMGPASSSPDGRIRPRYLGGQHFL